jgi:hypothetical protein
LFSSARELATFASVFLAGGRSGDRQPISGSAIQQLTKRQSDGLDDCGYTYGLADCTTQEIRTLSHYGFRSGSGSIVAFAPAYGVAIVILANRAGGILHRTESEAKRMLLGLGDEPDASTTPQAVLDPARLAGRYVHGPDAFTLTATADGVKYRYQDRDAQAVKGIGEDAIAVLDANGAPVQFFKVVKGRRSGETYLSDGLSAFRRR